jgi:hypothetical protein
MITKLVDEVRKSVLLIPDLALIKVALRGVPVKLSDSPDEDKKTSYRDYIMMGNYLNTINPDKEELIPRLSPLLLTVFAWINSKRCCRLYSGHITVRTKFRMATV